MFKKIKKAIKYIYAKIKYILKFIVAYFFSILEHFLVSRGNTTNNNNDSKYKLKKEDNEKKYSYENDISVPRDDSSNLELPELVIKEKRVKKIKESIRFESTQELYRFRKELIKLKKELPENYETKNIRENINICLVIINKKLGFSMEMPIDYERPEEYKIIEEKKGIIPEVESFKEKEEKKEIKKETKENKKEEIVIIEEKLEKKQEKEEKKKEEKEKVISFSDIALPVIAVGKTVLSAFQPVINTEKKVRKEVKIEDSDVEKISPEEVKKAGAVLEKVMKEKLEEINRLEEKEKTGLASEEKKVETLKLEEKEKETKIIEIKIQEEKKLQEEKKIDERKVEEKKKEEKVKEDKPDEKKYSDDIIRAIDLIEEDIKKHENATRKFGDSKKGVSFMVDSAIRISVSPAPMFIFKNKAIGRLLSVLMLGNSIRSARNSLSFSKVAYRRIDYNILLSRRKMLHEIEQTTLSNLVEVGNLKDDLKSKYGNNVYYDPELVSIMNRIESLESQLNINYQAIISNEKVMEKAKIKKKVF